MNTIMRKNSGTGTAPAPLFLLLRSSPLPRPQTAAPAKKLTPPAGDVSLNVQSADGTRPSALSVRIVTYRYCVVWLRIALEMASASCIVTLPS